tara:strand:+ start:2401 stop:2961 length:561 start_codon:yes stop_codon:yes gene_type:complete
MKRVSFTAQLASKGVRGNDFMVSDIKISAKANKGVVEFKFVTMRLFGAQGRGAIKVDLSGAVPLYHVDYSLSQFQIEKFFKKQVPQKVVAVQMDFSVKLSMRGETVKKIRQSAEAMLARISWSTAPILMRRLPVLVQSTIQPRGCRRLLLCRPGGFNDKQGLQLRKSVARVDWPQSNPHACLRLEG